MLKVGDQQKDTRFTFNVNSSANYVVFTSLHDTFTNDTSSAANTGRVCAPTTSIASLTVGHCGDGLPSGATLTGLPGAANYEAVTTNTLYAASTEFSFFAFEYETGSFSTNNRVDTAAFTAKAVVSSVSESTTPQDVTVAVYEGSS